MLGGLKTVSLFAQQVTVILVPPLPLTKYNSPKEYIVMQIHARVFGLTPILSVKIQVVILLHVFLTSRQEDRMEKTSIWVATDG